MYSFNNLFINQIKDLSSLFYKNVENISLEQNWSEKVRNN